MIYQAALVSPSPVDLWPLDYQVAGDVDNTEPVKQQRIMKWNKGAKHYAAGYSRHHFPDTVSYVRPTLSFLGF